MAVELERISKHFTNWVLDHEAAGAVGEIAQWLADGGVEPAEYTAIVDRHAVSREPTFREGLLDLILGYARDGLKCGLMSMVDVTNIRLLRMALHVGDGEFFDLRSPELSVLFERVFEGILADGRVDDWEDLYLVEVQTAFGLSYDQLLILARPALERVISLLEMELAGSDNEHWSDRKSALAKLAALEPTYRLSLLHRRSVGARFWVNRFWYEVESNHAQR